MLNYLVYFSPTFLKKMSSILKATYQRFKDENIKDVTIKSVVVVLNQVLFRCKVVVNRILRENCELS